MKKSDTPSNATEHGLVNGFGHACNALYFIGAVQLSMGVLFLFMPEKRAVMASIVFLVSGMVLIGLGFWAMYSGNKKPFWIAIGLCFCNLVLMFMTGAGGGIIATVILLFFLLRGLRYEPLPPAGSNALNEDAPLDSDL